MCAIRCNGTLRESIARATSAGTGTRHGHMRYPAMPKEAMSKDMQQPEELQESQLDQVRGALKWVYFKAGKALNEPQPPPPPPPPADTK